MPVVTYLGPSDVLDAKNVTGHALKLYPAEGSPEARPRGVRGGEPQELSDEALKELERQGHLFQVVDAPQQATAPQGESSEVSENAEPVPVIDAETGESTRKSSKKGA